MQQLSAAFADCPLPEKIHHAASELVRSTDDECRNSCLPLRVQEAIAVWDVPARSTLLVSGRQCDVCFGLKAGMIELAHASAEGEATLIDVLEPGQWFGVEDIARSGVSTFAAESGPASSLLVIRRAVLIQLIERDAQVCSWLLAAASVRANRISERLRVLTNCSPDERVRWAIEMLAKRFGYAVHNGLKIGVRMTQAQLARIAGTSRQAVNMVMMRMKDENRLSTNSGWIVVKRPS